MGAGTQSQEDIRACSRFDEQLVVRGPSSANLRWSAGLMTPIDDRLVDLWRRLSSPPDSHGISARQSSSALPLARSCLKRRPVGHAPQPL